MQSNRGERLVYSTGKGTICPACRQPVAQCTCKNRAPQPEGDGIVRVHRQTKGRGGKGVSLIMGLPLDDAQLEELASKLKRRCGTGGTVKDGVIEIQGDHRDTLVTELQKLGYTVKKAGG